MVDNYRNQRLGFLEKNNFQWHSGGQLSSGTSAHRRADYFIFAARISAKF
jgi:hypothetical protein